MAVSEQYGVSEHYAPFAGPEGNGLAALPSTTTLSDYAIAGLVCMAISAVCLFFNTNVAHWFIIPTIGCGVLIGSDGVAWLRRKMDTFDPKGLVGAFGLHFFFFAPVLHVTVGGGMSYIEPPPDWRPWLGILGLLNFVGLLCYKGMFNLAQRGFKRFKTVWVAQPGKAWPVLGIAIMFSVAAEAVILVKMGGLSGLATAHTESQADTWSGLGPIRATSYALALLCFIVLTIFRRAGGFRIAGKTAVLIMLGGIGLIQLVVTGLTTYRSLIAAGLVCVAIGVHFFWRPVKRRTILIVIIPLTVLMWLYSFYKELGVNVGGLYGGGGSIGYLTSATGRSWAGSLLGDMSRTNVQAYMVYKLIDQPNSYDLRWGKTYPTAVYTLIPQYLWPGKPFDVEKVVAGTDLLNGKGWYQPQIWYRALNAYGIAGEAMLNFGIWSIPLAYGVLGLILGRFSRWLRGILPGDLRLLIAPYGIWMMPNFLLWDADNYVAHAFFAVSVAFAALFCAVTRIPREQYLQELGGHEMPQDASEDGELSAARVT